MPLLNTVTEDWTDMLEDPAVLLKNLSARINAVRDSL